MDEKQSVILGAFIYLILALLIMKTKYKR